MQKRRKNKRPNRPTVAPPPNPRRFYDTETKLRAVAAMLTADREHPIGALAIAAAQESLGMATSISTLARWIGQYRDQVLPSLAQPADVASVVRGVSVGIVADMVEVRNKVMTHLKQPEIIAAMSGRDSAVVAGIMNDHIIKMTGLSSEDEQLMQRFIVFCQRHDIDHTEALEDYMLSNGTQSIEITAH